MTAEKLNKLWLLAAGILILIIIVSGIVILIKRDNGKALSISMPPEPKYSGQVYIDGLVSRPGAYSFGPDESMSDLIKASGGLLPGADMAALQIHIPSAVVSPGFQKVDINRAESWLLQALPGIGETKAQAILDYRAQIGHFDNIEQLLGVPGISDSVFNKIKAFITTGE